MKEPSTAGDEARITIWEIPQYLPNTSTCKLLTLLYLEQVHWRSRRVPRNLRRLGIAEGL